MNEITPFFSLGQEYFFGNTDAKQSKGESEVPSRFPKEVQKTFYSELTCFCQSAAMVINNITFYSPTLNQNRQ